MKSIPLPLSLVVVSAFFLAAHAQDVTIETAPPVVVKTVPEAGTKDVDPTTTEIKVTFSKDMADKSWSWSQISDESFPKTTGKPHYQADNRTCVLPVKLEPGKTYVLWLNPEKFQGFRDTGGHPSVFYPLIFKTKDAEAATAKADSSAK
jgi:hypothetical protein